MLCCLKLLKMSIYQVLLVSEDLDLLWHVLVYRMWLFEICDRATIASDPAKPAGRVYHYAYASERSADRIRSLNIGHEALVGGLEILDSRDARAT